VVVPVKGTIRLLIDVLLKLLEDLEEVFKEKEHPLQLTQLEVKVIRLQQVLFKDLILEMQVVVQNIDMAVAEVLEQQEEVLLLVIQVLELEDSVHQIL
jgi:hypothetical protein